MGNLFWATTRTSETSNANLHLDFCKVSMPYVRVHVPRASAPTKQSNAQKAIPQVPVLRNKRTVLTHTKLVALHDKMVEKQRDEDMEAAKSTKLKALEDLKNAKKAAASDPGEASTAKRRRRRDARTWQHARPMVAYSILSTRVLTNAM